MTFTEVITHVRENASYIIMIFGIFGIAIDMTPWIRINPVRRFFRQIGKLLNGDLLAKIDDMDEKIKATQEESDKRRIKDVRYKILDFSNSLSKRQRDKEEFEELMDLHIEYIKLIEKYEMENGRVDRAMKNIEYHYEQLLH